MKSLKIIHYLQLIFISMLFIFCSNSMDQLYLLEASSSAYPTGTPIDNNGDGKVDGLDVNNDGIVDMKFVKPNGPPATGIDINNDGVADFYMYSSATGTSFNTKSDGKGTTVTVIIKSGVLIGYDTNGDGVSDINVSGSTVSYYAVSGAATGVTSSITLSLTINNSSFEYLTISANGAYAFTSKLNTGYFYTVAIASSTQQCNLTGTAASGVIAASDITGINVTCGTLAVPVTVVWDGDTVATPGPGPYPIGSMMLSLTINNLTTEFLSIAAYSGAVTSHSDATTTFLSKLNTGSFYKVLIVSSTDNCTIASNTGTMPIGATITIKCAKITVDNSGIVGLPANHIVGLSELPTPNSVTLSLSINGTFKETTTVTKTLAGTSTDFSFPNTRLFAGDAYNVQIVSSTQSCKISSNTGVISTTAPANITNVAVVCAKDVITMTLDHPTGGGMTLVGNLILSLSVNGSVVENKTFLAGAADASTKTFTTQLYGGDVYNVQIVSLSENCAVANGTATAPGTGAIAVTINCGRYAVGGSITNVATCASVSVTMTIQLVGSTLPPNIVTHTVFGGPGFTLTSPSLLFKANDFYTVNMASFTATGCLNRNVCSFVNGNPNSVTVLSKTAQHPGGGPDNTVNVYCW